MALTQIAGAGMKFVEQAFKAQRDDGQVSNPSRNSEGHSAAQPRSVNFQQALANRVSKAPQAITTTPQSGNSDTRRAAACQLCAV